MTNTITIKDIREYVSTIADDIMNEREHWSEDDLQDIISEHADGSRFVIYYHDFLHALDRETRNNAEETARCYYKKRKYVTEFYDHQDKLKRTEYYTCGTHITYDEMASIITYCALELLISEELSARLDREKAA
jgi:hypothetical protein